MIQLMLLGFTLRFPRVSSLSWNIRPWSELSRTLVAGATSFALVEPSVHLVENALIGKRGCFRIEGGCGAMLPRVMLVEANISDASLARFSKATLPTTNVLVSLPFVPSGQTLISNNRFDRVVQLRV